MKLLESLLGEDQMIAFRTNNTYHYLNLMIEFELKIRNLDQGIQSIRLPYSLIEKLDSIPKLDSKLQKAFGKESQITGDRLKFDESCIIEILSNSVKDTIKIINGIKRPKFNMVIIGGYAENKLLKYRLKKIFSNKQIIVPDEPTIAVVKGAVLVGHNPLYLETRFAEENQNQVAVDFSNQPQSIEKQNQRDGGSSNQPESIENQDQTDAGSSNQLQSIEKRNQKDGGSSNQLQSIVNQDQTDGGSLNQSQSIEKRNQKDGGPSNQPLSIVNQDQTDGGPSNQPLSIVNQDQTDGGSSNQPQSIVNQDQTDGGPSNQLQSIENQNQTDSGASN